jgi:hypothetical protein
LDWLRKQVASTNPPTGIPAVKLQRFAAEARVLNVARMKELREEKRFALAAANWGRTMKLLIERGWLNALSGLRRMFVHQIGVFADGVVCGLVAQQITNRS